MILKLSQAIRSSSLSISVDVGGKDATGGGGGGGGRGASVTEGSDCGDDETKAGLGVASVTGVESGSLDISTGLADVAVASTIVGATSADCPPISACLGVNNVDDDGCGGGDVSSGTDATLAPLASPSGPV